METSIIWAWVIWLAIGGLAGWLAGRVMGSRPFGLIGDIVIGVLGGLIGGWIASLFGFVWFGGLWSFIIAFLGALLLLWIIRLFKKA